MSTAAGATRALPQIPRSTCPKCGEEIFRRSTSTSGIVVKSRWFVLEPNRAGKLVPLIGCKKCGASLRIRKGGGLLLLFARPPKARAS